VKELLVNPPRTDDDRFKNSDNWCDEDDLPELTRCMVRLFQLSKFYHQLVACEGIHYTLNLVGRNENYCPMANGFKK